MNLYSMVPQDSSGKVRWLLMELGVPFEEKKLSYRAGDLKTESYLSKNPIGQIPVLEDEDLSIYESHAIVAYLADKHVKKCLAPATENIDQRAKYYQWMFFTCNTVEDFFGRLQRLSESTDEHKDQWGDYIHDKVQKVMQTIEKQIENQDYILGHFSAVDVCLGSALDAVADEPFFRDFPKVQAYYKRLSERDACVKSEIFKRS